MATAGAGAAAAAPIVAPKSADGRVLVETKLTLDVACPWCFIGARRLKAALNTLDSKQYDVQITVHPFLLNAEAPTPGLNRDEIIKKKYGLSDEKLQAMHKTMAEKGQAQAQITFNPAAGNMGNTIDSLRLVEWAYKTYGSEKALAVLDAVESEVFEHSKDPSLHATLLAGVKRVSGIDEKAAAAFLATDELRADILKRAADAKARGVKTVPNILVNGHFAEDGSQTDFAAFFKQIGVAK